MIAVDDVTDGVEQAAFAAAHNHILFVKIGGKAEPVEGRAGADAAAVIPRAARAADGAVHQVRDVGDGQERYLRAVEGAAAGGSAGLRGAAAGFLLLVVLAGGFVQQRQNFLSLHSDLVDGGRPER